MSRRRRFLGTGHNRLTMFHTMPHSMIKSIQANTITLASAASNTATITAVAPENSIILWLGGDIDNNTAAPRDNYMRVTLTNSTTVTANRGNAGTTTGIVSFVVIEFWPGVIRQVQRGTVTIANTSTSGTYTISPAIQSTAKAFVFLLGWSSDATTTTGRRSEQPKVVLTNTTTVTASRSGSTDALTVGVQVVEFY